MAEENLFRDLMEILMRASNEIEQACKDSSEPLDLDTCLVLIAECFRCLRNACVQCAKNQHIMRYSFDPFLLIQNYNLLMFVWFYTDILILHCCVDLLTAISFLIRSLEMMYASSKNS